MTRSSSGNRAIRDWLSMYQQLANQVAQVGAGTVVGARQPRMSGQDDAEADQAPLFRIGMLGPSRVGKTSLTAAMLTDSEISLADTQLVLRPSDERTRAILRLHREELEGGLLAGRFKTEVMPHSAAATEFNLTLRHSQASKGISFSLLDFPGGWLKDGVVMTEDGIVAVSEHDVREWRRVRNYLTECNVLIIPVDAVILMTAVKDTHKRSIPVILEILAVQEIVEEWARYRQERSDEPALVILAPLKAERYFADNGGREDRSEQLQELTLRAYARPIELVRKAARHAQLLYCPVDTLGCVELVRSEWRPVEGREGIEKPTAVFAVRRSGRDGTSGYPISVVGADEILISICRMLAESQARFAENAAERLTDAADRAQERRVDLGSAFFRRLWNTYNGRIAQAEREGQYSREEAVRQRAYATALETAVGEIAKRPLGRRGRAL